MIAYLFVARAENLLTSTDWALWYGFQQGTILALIVF